MRISLIVPMCEPPMHFQPAQDMGEEGEDGDLPLEDGMAIEMPGGGVLHVVEGDSPSERGRWRGHRIGLLYGHTNRDRDSASSRATFLY